MNTRSQVYRDWLFRLLREDMFSEPRDDLRVTNGRKKNKRKPVTLGEMKLVNIDVDKMTMRHIHPYSLFVACGQGVKFPRNMSTEKKVNFLANSKHFMKHEFFGTLCCDDKIIAFGSLVRDDANLLKSPPIVGLRFTALEAQLIDHKQPSLDVLKPIKLDALLDRCRTAFEAGSRMTLPLNFTLSKKIHLQDAQLKSFIHELSSDLALIQGPPGTRKLFMGAIIFLNILRLTPFRVPVLSYTNHALDQFLEDLMDIGVSSDQIVRLGSKSTDATKPTLLHEYDGQKR